MYVNVCLLKTFICFQDRETDLTSWTILSAVKYSLVLKTIAALYFARCTGICGHFLTLRVTHDLFALI